jgi:hypothetical protein
MTAHAERRRGTPLLFMSPEHVAVMNEMLSEDEQVRQACSELDRPVTIAYELADGPDASAVHWSMTFADTVRFGLAPIEADILFVGDWARMVRATRAGRDGDALDPGLEVVGDYAGFEAVAPVFAIAKRVATLPVEFPDL